MISIQTILDIHKTLIDQFGGVHGIRDYDSLESALSRPFQVFENEELYPGIIHKAASLIESLIANHPFIDGNKRTGYVVMRLFLINHYIDIVAPENDKYDFVISIASGNMGFEKIVDWLQNHTEKQNIS